MYNVSNKQTHTHNYKTHTTKFYKHFAHRIQTFCKIHAIYLVMSFDYDPFEYQKFLNIIKKVVCA